MAHFNRVDRNFPGSIVERPAAWLRTLASRLNDPYRPELHYMRGPGPKWREKHSPAPVEQVGDFGLHNIWKAGA